MNAFCNHKGSGTLCDFSGKRVETPVVLKDVYIGHRGTIFDKNKKLIYINNYFESSGKHGGSGYPDFTGREFNHHRVVEELNGEYIYMLHWWDIHVWGHIMDDFTRLCYFQSDRFNDIPVLHNPGHFSSWPGLSYRESFTKHLEMMGIDRLRQKEIHGLSENHKPQAKIYKVKSLHLASSRTTLDGYEFMRDNWLKNLNLSDEKNGNNKIYLSRPHMTKQRVVKNNSEVEDYLKQEGFYIWTGEEPFEVQVRLFRDADVIIGPHGAALFNCIFRKPNSLVLEFTPKGRATRVYVRQSEVMQHKNHKLIECDSDENFNHEIDIEKIKYELSRYKKS